MGILGADCLHRGAGVLPTLGATRLGRRLMRTYTEALAICNEIWILTNLDQRIRRTERGSDMVSDVDGLAHDGVGSCEGAHRSAVGSAIGLCRSPICEGLDG